MDEGAPEPAEILVGHEVASEVRRAVSIEVDQATIEDVERRLDAYRDAIAGFFDVRLGGREGAGFLRYGPGGFYRPHRDRADAASWPGASRRRIALVIFLNDDFSGGTLRLLEDEPTDVAPRAGTLVAFPATALHEVRPVHSGTRDVVVDWFLE
jgi:predicted 2-oxoglutarate/Fe(II)-dependent dioxygenase YbiX